MAAEDLEKSLSDEATYAGRAGPRHSPGDHSIGDGQTLGGNDASGFAAVVDDIEVVDLEARYTIEGTLGQGGMGAVLLATDTRLGRKVAIKRILGEAARSKTATQRFLTEAKAIASVGDHPNIVQIYDYGQAKDGPFLIMEYVDGGSLAERCKAAALPLEEAVELACRLCNGLGKAHDAGIIHRDIKPANVLLSADGVPKLTDFGLAKAEASDHGMTMTGSVMGTPDFMPPEQRRDASLVDHRSDLWSLAATVYQMLTGRSPKIIRLADVPAGLQNILAKALEEEKDARYQSAREFQDALRATLALAEQSGRFHVGECPGCGASNASTRKFCRGCGGTLEARCPACSVTIPLWDDFCGNCGSRQSELIDDRRRASKERQSAAEKMFSEGAYDEAVAIAARLEREPDPRLRTIKQWAEDFLERVETHKIALRQQAESHMREARVHYEAADYSAALKTLKQIHPNAKTHESNQFMQDVQSVCDEIALLDTQINQKIADSQISDVLPIVKRYLHLKPTCERTQALWFKLLKEDAENKEVRRKELEIARQQALQELDSLSFDRAIALAKDIEAEARAGFSEFSQWASQFIANASAAQKKHAMLLQRDAMEIAKEKALKALSSCSFEQAVDIAKELATESDPDFADLSEWAFCFIAKVAEESEKHDIRLANSIAGAQGHCLSGDFDLAARELEDIPEAGRTGVVNELLRDVLSLKLEAHSQRLGTLFIRKPTEVVKNSIGMRLACIPGGQFAMGEGNETHEVTLTRAFFIGVHPVTNANWARIMGNPPSKWKEPSVPVETVSWNDAVAFCQRLSELPHEKNMGRVYRLPTESEWEYACRAGTRTSFSFGENSRAARLRDHGWYTSNSQRGWFLSKGRTMPVCKKDPNPWGLYDMHGNVWEWCSDWWTKLTSKALVDPMGATHGEHRALRGGSWNDRAENCRSSNRGLFLPAGKDSNIGFRVAVTLASPECIEGAHSLYCASESSDSALPSEVWWFWKVLYVWAILVVVFAIAVGVPLAVWVLKEVLFF